MCAADIIIAIYYFSGHTKICDFHHIIICNKNVTCSEITMDALKTDKNYSSKNSYNRCQYMRGGFQILILFIKNNKKALNYTFLDARNLIPLHTCIAVETRFAIVRYSPVAKSSSDQVGWNICLLLRRKSNKLPFEQYSVIMYSLGYFVHAPRTFTMFSCCPT